MHVLAPFEHYRPASQAQELERCEHSGGPRAYDYYRLGSVHIEVVRGGIWFIGLIRTIDLNPVAQQQ